MDAEDYEAQIERLEMKNDELQGAVKKLELLARVIVMADENAQRRRTGGDPWATSINSVTIDGVTIAEYSRRILSEDSELSPG